MGAQIQARESAEDVLTRNAGAEQFTEKVESDTSGAEAREQKKGLTAAVNRCATQNQALSANCEAATEARVYRRSTAVVSRQISGETLVVPIRGKVGDLASIYSFNEEGSVLWAALEQSASLENLAAVLCQSFEVEWDDARQDADTFVQEMQAAGLLSAV
jgi:hypothetical protein